MNKSKIPACPAGRKNKKSKLHIKIQNFTFWFVILIFAFCILNSNCYAQSEKFFEIRAKKFSYTPNIIKVNKGDLVKIRLISEDVTHGLFIDGYGQNTKAHPGEEGYLEFIADKPGRYSFRCSVTCGEFHPYMIGYLVVEPNLRFLFYLLMVVSIGLAVFLFINFKKKKEIQSNESNEQQE